MKSIVIKGTKRESVGKKATKALRNADKVPCVIYGGENVIHFSALLKEFKPLVYTPQVFTASIELEEKTILAILQDIQFHPTTDEILHIDFYQLHSDKEVTLEIPVKIKGSSPGVLIGGALRQNMRKLKVKALPKHLPDYIYADVSNLNIGNKLYVTHLKTDNYVFLHPDNTVVVQVKMSRNASKTSEAEEKISKKEE